MRQPQHWSCDQDWFAYLTDIVAPLNYFMVSIKTKVDHFFSVFLTTNQDGGNAQVERIPQGILGPFDVHLWKDGTTMKSKLECLLSRSLLIQSELHVAHAYTNPSA